MISVASGTEDVYAIHTCSLPWKSVNQLSMHDYGRARTCVSSNQPFDRPWSYAFKIGSAVAFATVIAALVLPIEHILTA